MDADETDTPEALLCLKDATTAGGIYLD